MNHRQDSLRDSILSSGTGPFSTSQNQSVNGNANGKFLADTSLFEKAILLHLLTFIEKDAEVSVGHGFRGEPRESNLSLAHRKSGLGSHLHSSHDDN